MEPTYSAAEDSFPVEIARLKARGSFIAAIVKYDRYAHAKPLIAIDRRHVWTGDAVMRETLIEWLDAHGLDALGNQMSDGIIHHRSRNTGPQLETVCQVGGHIKFAATDVNPAFNRFVKGNNARVQPVYKCAEG